MIDPFTTTSSYVHIPAERWETERRTLPLGAVREHGRRLSWGGSCISIIGSPQHRHAETQYTVRLDSGHWPADTDLITLCDGTVPPDKNHFGGHVAKDGAMATVTVYID